MAVHAYLRLSMGPLSSVMYLYLKPGRFMIGVVRVEEVVIGRVWHEHLVTYIVGIGAAVSRRRSPFGVQALDEGSFGEKFSSRWSLVCPN